MNRSVLLLLILMSAAANSNAQIPNSGFENWTSMGTYYNPDSWSCLNNMTSTMNIFTCLKGSPGYPGNSYIKLVSKTVPGMGVVPGIAVSGSLDSVSMQAVSGFSFNQRPYNLTGNWQHMIYGSSQGFIEIQLTRWDNIMQIRKTVASAHYELSGMAMGWEAFDVLLTYNDGTDPDSCIITLAASGNAPANNDYLYVDNLAFAGNVTGVAENNLDKYFSFSPNPASDALLLDLHLLKDKSVSVQVKDVTGKRIYLTNINVSDKNRIDISSLPKGIYFLNIITSEAIITKKFIKQQ